MQGGLGLLALRTSPGEERARGGSWSGAGCSPGRAAEGGICQAGDCAPAAAVCSLVLGHQCQSQRGEHLVPTRHQGRSAVRVHPAPQDLVSLCLPQRLRPAPPGCGEGTDGTENGQQDESGLFLPPPFRECVVTHLLAHHWLWATKDDLKWD